MPQLDCAIRLPIKAILANNPINTDPQTERSGYCGVVWKNENSRYNMLQKEIYQMGDTDGLNIAKKYGERFEVNTPYLTLTEYDSSYLAYSGLEIQGNDWIHKFKAIKVTDVLPTIVRFLSPMTGTSRTQTYLITVNEEKPPAPLKPPAPFIGYRAFYHGHGEPIHDFDYMLGEIKLFPFIRTVSWFKLCNGAPMNISENKNFYYLISGMSGTCCMDSADTFNIPNLTSKIPIAGLTYQICTSGPIPGNLVRSPDELIYHPVSCYSDQYLSEIILAKNVCGQESQWLTACDGRILNINNYSALFCLLGTDFGGDMRYTTFALPDLSAVEPPVAGTMYYMVTHGRFPDFFNYN